MACAGELDSRRLQMHSYMAHNGMLSTVYLRLQDEKADLAQLVHSLPGGREAILIEAAERRAELEAQQATVNEASTPLDTPDITHAKSGQVTPVNSTAHSETSEGFRRHLISLTNPSDTSINRLRSASDTSLDGSGIRRRSTSKPTRKKSTLATDVLPEPQPDLPVGTSLEPSYTVTPRDSRPPAVLAWSTNQRVALLARNIDAMEDELKSNGAKGLVWPQNVTYGHFFDYFCIPTLVYQLEYPRTTT